MVLPGRRPRQSRSRCWLHSFLRASCFYSFIAHPSGIEGWPPWRRGRSKPRARRRCRPRKRREGQRRRLGAGILHTLGRGIASRRAASSAFKWGAAGRDPWPEPPARPQRAGVVHGATFSVVQASTPRMWARRAAAQEGNKKAAFTFVMGGLGRREGERTRSRRGADARALAQGGGTREVRARSPGRARDFAEVACGAAKAGLPNRDDGGTRRPLPRQRAFQRAERLLGIGAACARKRSRAAARSQRVAHSRAPTALRPPAREFQE